MSCKKCWSTACHKAWFVRGLQRYKCKECWCFYTDTSDRKASMNIKLQALQLYTLWLWFRAIGKFLNYSHVAIYYWIRDFWLFADQLHQENKQEWKIIEYIEMDELRHYVEKKVHNFGYGLLSIDWTTNLLILPSEIAAQKHEKNYENN